MFGMFDFLNENFNSISRMLFLSIFLGCILQFFSAKSYVDSQSKKRIKKGLAAMTDEEKKMAIETHRTAITSTCLAVLGIYVITLIVTYIFFR